MSPPPDNSHALMFVDVDGINPFVEEVVDAFQELPHRLTHTSTLLLRWPDITCWPDSAQEAELDQATVDWAETISREAVSVGYGQLHTGVVRFRVGANPVITWAGGAGQTEDRTSELLQRALQVELRTLMDWGRAVWRPTDYHYVLPSGHHAGAFIRVGDAFRTVRDVRVIASWLTPRLRDGIGVVMDSASLIPLATDLASLLSQRGWTAGPVETLDEYPRTGFDVAQAVRPLQASQGGVLGLLSVSSSGHYRDLMFNALNDQGRPSNSWSMVVIVDKGDGGTDRLFATDDGGTGIDRVSTWLEVEDGATDRLSDGSCRWCATHERVQLVRIDPMSFEALALPGHRLITPDVVAAKDSVGLWQSCDAAEAVGVAMPPESGPSIVARPKSARMSVIVDWSQLLEKGLDELQTQVLGRLVELRKAGESFDFSYRTKFMSGTEPLPACDGVLVSTHDLERPGFRKFFDFLMNQVGLPGIDPTPVDLRVVDHEAPPEVRGWRHGLLFSLGVVSGWGLRQLQLAAEDRWQGLHDRQLSALVVHARPSTRREWETLARPLDNRLHALWRTYLPWRSPLGEEQEHLYKFQLDLLDLGETARSYFDERQRYLSQEGPSNWVAWCDAYQSGDGSPSPYSILWGLPPTGTGRSEVRTRSNYGYQVRAVTAYAAIGAAMQGAREVKGVQDDPRRLVFELQAVCRMYYDGLLIASILRWCEPHEAYWGDSDDDAWNAISELITRTQDEGDQKVLFPELLLAASQGKIPAGAKDRLVAQVESQIAGWSDQDRAAVDVGFALLAYQPSSEEPQSVTAVGEVALPDTGGPTSVPVS
jgi:hypothetical protein